MNGRKSNLSFLKSFPERLEDQDRSHLTTPLFLSSASQALIFKEEVVQRHLLADEQEYRVRVSRFDKEISSGMQKESRN